MIYDQQGKSLLVIKSSLSAFESEITYTYPHVSFQSPEEFQELVIQHFYKKCLLVVNDDTIRFSHPQVMLGHETTLVAEIEHLPSKIESLYIQNMVFGDIYNSVCEVILSKSDFAQKQFLLNADNNREARLVVENGSWVISETQSHWLTKSMFSGMFDFFSVSTREPLSDPATTTISLPPTSLIKKRALSDSDSI